MPRYNQAKSIKRCDRCRKDRQKCLPSGRTWPGRRCDRCLKYDYTCSASKTRSEASSMPPLSDDSTLVTTTAAPKPLGQYFQEIGDVRKVLDRFLKLRGASSEVPSDIRDCLRKVSEDANRRVGQDQADGLYFEAMYLSRRLFKLWIWDIESKNIGILPAQYNPASVVFLYEKIGDFPAAELAQEKIITKLSCLDHSSAQAKSLVDARKNLLRLYSLSQQRLSNLGTLDDLQIFKIHLYRETKLYFPNTNADITILKMLIESMKCQADIDIQDIYGRTALCIAAEWGHDVLLSLLLQMSANTNIKGHGSLTALHMAVLNGKEGSVQLLLENGADVNAVTDIGCLTPYTVALQKHADIAQILLSYGVNIDVRGKLEEFTALHFAVIRRHECLANILLEHGANANIMDKQGNTALHYAVIGKHENLASMLLKYGANHNIKDGKGETALHGATYRSTNLMQILLEHRANTDLKTDDGEAAIHIAARCDSTNRIKLLLEHGANIDSRAKNGETALHLAIVYSMNTVRILLQHGADTKITDKWGRTALYFAVDLGRTDRAEALVAARADVNARNCHKRTALHKATERGNEEMVKLLLNSGAEVGAVDDRGENAVGIATRQGFKKIVELLETAVGMSETAAEIVTPSWIWRLPPLGRGISSPQ